MASRALVVGVPDTEVPGFLPLAGASKDARDIANLLGARGFGEVLLRPDGIYLNEFTSLLVQLRSVTLDGDLGLIYVSGHGYRRRDNNGDERDGYDEMLVLTDGKLPDDWFSEHFWPYVHTGSQWVTCADTCFGATAILAARVPQENEIDDVALPAVRRPADVSRISLAAAGESAEALQISADNYIASWYTSQIIDLLQDVPDMTYEQLWNRLHKRWLVAQASRYAELASPWMAMTDSAFGLSTRPAFASATYAPKG